MSKFIKNFAKSQKSKTQGFVYCIKKSLIISVIYVKKTKMFFTYKKMTILFDFINT